MPSALGLTRKMKWKGKETIGFTSFLLPCHNKHKKIFFLFSLSMKKEESLCTFDLKGPRYSHVDYSSGSLYHSDCLLLRFSALNRCLSRYVHCPFFLFFDKIPCRFFFLQARLEAYICKYPRGIMNQRLTPDAFRQEWLQEREAGELPGQESFPDERCKLS